MLLDIIGLAEFPYSGSYNAFIVSGFILASKQAEHTVKINYKSLMKTNTTFINTDNEHAHHKHNHNTKGKSGKKLHLIP